MLLVVGLRCLLACRRDLGTSTFFAGRGGAEVQNALMCMTNLADHKSITAIPRGTEMEETVGFKPTSPVRGLLFSRQVHSFALPRLLAVRLVGVEPTTLCV